MYIKLKEHQERALELCKKNRQFGVFFDMGTGKTAVLLSLVDYLVFDKLEVKSVLIIAPSQVINRSKVWQEEMKKWKNFEFFDYMELSGDPTTRIEKKEKGFTIHLISDVLIVWYKKTYGHLNDYDMIIVDESARFKNPTAKKFKALSEMIDLQKHRIYLLTGTPTPNGYDDLWSQIYLLDKGKRLGKSFRTYQAIYSFQVSKYKYVYSKASIETIKETVNDICIFGENIKGLPPKIEHRVMLSFTEDKKKKYNDFVNSYILELKEGEITVFSKQELLNKCLQLANGNVYVDNKLNYEVFDNTKWRWCYNFLKNNPEKNVLIYYNFKSDKEQLLKLPNARAIMTYKDVKDWNDGKIKAGIISPFSFQYGANLQQGGYTVIWYGLVWSLENFLQANRRLWRFGQTHQVDVYYLLMIDTYHLGVYETLVKKNKTQRDFLESIKL